MSRLALERGGPRDLGAVRDGSARGAARARALLRDGAGGIGLPDGARHASPRRLAALRRRACRACSPRALVDEPPLLRRDGGFVRAGFRADLDEAAALRDDSRRVIAALEARYVGETGVKTLKIRHNNVLGYFIEVPRRRRPSRC